MEDSFAERMVITALRYGGIEMDAVKVHAMGGHTPAITVNQQHNNDPTAAFKSICLLDGDQRDKVDEDDRIFALPGDQYPEAHVFQSVFDQIDAQAARLTVSLQLPSDSQERVKDAVRACALTNRDRHLIFGQIGDVLDFTSAETVENAFLAIWAQTKPDEVEALLAGFVDEVPHRENIAAPAAPEATTVSA